MFDPKLWHFEKCLLTFAHAHSWYKFRDRKVTVVIMPFKVTSRHLDEHKGAYPPYDSVSLETDIKEGDIAWCFSLNEDWPKLVKPELHQVIKDNMVTVNYLWFGNGLNDWKNMRRHMLEDADAGKSYTREEVTNIFCNLLRSHVKFAGYFVPFNDCFTKAKAAALKIAECFKEEDLEPIIPPDIVDDEVEV